MIKMAKRVFSLLLALSIVLSLVTVGALAEPERAQEPAGQPTPAPAAGTGTVPEVAERTAEELQTGEPLVLTCKTAEHTHTDACYTETRELTCGREEAEAVPAHTHNNDCYAFCGHKEGEGAVEAHTHTAGCYAEGDMTTEPICGKEEGPGSPGHQHTGTECYRYDGDSSTKILNCGQEETEGSEGHTHTDACYQTVRTLACTQTEHVHSAAECYRPAVAMVRETGEYYATLQEAINAAGNNQTVQLMKDVLLGTYISVNKNISLDLNGKTVSCNNANGAFVVMSKTLTIDDTSGEKDGVVKGTSNYGCRVYGAAATLTVENGTVSGAKVGIYTVGNVNIEGGSVTGGKYGIQLSGNKTVTVKGGTVTGNTIGVAATNGTVSMSGGTVSGGSHGISAQNNAKSVSLSGGTVSGKTAGVYAAGSKLAVSVESVVTSSDGYGVWFCNGATLQVKDGADISGKSGVIVAYNPDENDLGAKLIMTGGNVTGAQYGISGNGSNDNTTIEIAGGTITGGVTAIYHPQVGDMTISGGTITGKNGVQYSGAGNLTITGGTVTATLPYTEAPQKPETQSDGTVADGAALSIVSRGGGWQSSESEVMNVTVSGGELISEYNSAVAVYRIKQDPTTNVWFVGDETGLPSYLERLTITGGTFTGSAAKGVLDIEELAMGAKSVTGGTFSEDIDDTAGGRHNYVDNGYASHPVRTPENYFNVHRPAEQEGWSHDDDGHWTTCVGQDCLVVVTEKTGHNYDAGAVTREPTYDTEGERTFTCADCGHTHTEPIPVLERTYYTLIINYVCSDGSAAPARVRRSLESGARYSVDSPALEGYTPDRAVVSGRLTRSTTITVTYTPVRPEPTAEPTVEPTVEPTAEPTVVPTAEPTVEPTVEPTAVPTAAPTAEPTAEPTVEPTAEPTPAPTEDPGEEEDLGDEDPPLAEVPETGDGLGLWTAVALAAAAGLVWAGLTRKREKAE